MYDMQTRITEQASFKRIVRGLESTLPLFLALSSYRLVPTLVTVLSFLPNLSVAKSSPSCGVSYLVEEVNWLIGNIMLLAVLIGYSLGLAASIRAMLFMRKEARRIEEEELICGYVGRSTRAVKADPDGTAAGIAAWSGMLLFVFLSILLMNDPAYPFHGDMDSAFDICFSGVLLLTLPFTFYYVASGGYDVAIFSDGGIKIRVLRTGKESDIAWTEVEGLSYTTSEGGFANYRLKIGKLSFVVEPRGERNKTIMNLVVRHVPRSLWHGEDMPLHLKTHFGIVTGEPTGDSS